MLAAVIIGHLNSKAVVLYLRIALRPMGCMINNMIGKEKKCTKELPGYIFYAFHQTFSTSQFKLNPSGYGNHYWYYLKKIKDIKMWQGKPPEIGLSFFLALCRDSHYCLLDILS